MDYFKKIITDIELHNVEGIRICFQNGVNPNDSLGNKPLINQLTSEYLRSNRFKQCVQAFVDFGLEYEDKALLSVLLDDANLLKTFLKKNPDLTDSRYTLKCSYTPLEEVTLLHICAEYNHINCAKVLVEFGADLNARGGFDKYEFGGQTPIFHTVNQNMNQSAEMLEYLLEKSADLTIQVKGFIWGKTYEWETLIPSVNPISYAMMGLLPQMHRNEKNINDIVLRLLKKEYGINYKSKNIPNKYLMN